MAIGRRRFIAALGSAVAWPVAARAQQSATPVIGFLGSGSPEPYADYLAAIRQGLGQSGFIENRNVTIAYRWAEGRYDRLPALADELVRLGVKVIMTSGGGNAALAAKAATTSIPIVFHMGADPVGLGVVSSLSRPGGNVTGVSFLTALSGSKRLEILHQLVPSSKTIGVLVNPDNASVSIPVKKDLQAAAPTLGLDLEIGEARNPPEIDAAFAKFTERQVGAIFVTADTFFRVQLVQIVGLSRRYGIPAMYNTRDFVEQGGLMSYGASIVDAYRLEGVYVGRVLNGEKPADLPVVQSTKFELVLNRKTANTLGLNIPPTLFAIADDVIE